MKQNGRTAADEQSEIGETCHASCVVLGEDGVLIRGGSGSGKSTLCLRLLDEAIRAGRHARLVADDRVRVHARNGRLIGQPHPALVGMIEIRGFGLQRLPTHASAAMIRLVVDIVDIVPRLPVASLATAEVLGLRLPVLNLVRDQPREYLIREALSTVRRKSVSSQTHSGAVFGEPPFCV